MYNLKFDVSYNKLLAFRSETKIKEIKEKLEENLRNYCHSYQYVSSKKVLERKLINSIIFIILKNHYNLFNGVKLNENWQILSKKN